jgi:hypothetical protein
MRNTMIAMRTIRKVLQPALADDFELLDFMTHRAYAIGVPLDMLRGKNRDELIHLILKPTPSDGNHWSELTAIAQTVALLGEGMKITRELATAAKEATGFLTNKKG